MHDAANSAFSVCGLSFSYDGQRSIFDGFDLDIAEGAITTLIGANGCGKSTLFNLLTKNLRPQQGEVLLRGVPVDGLRLREFAQQVAIVHQSNSAPGDITVAQLVEYGRFPFRRRGAAGSAFDAQMVEWAIRTCGLEAVAAKPVSALSGGQRQRVWIAMALAQGCDVLLLDEPTTYLDVRYQLDILNLVRSLNRELGMTIVMVLHDVNQALCYSDEVVALAQGEAVAQGAPADVVSTALLREVYGVELDIVQVNGHPFVIAADEEEETPLPLSREAALNPTAWIAAATTPSPRPKGKPALLQRPIPGDAELRNDGTHATPSTSDNAARDGRGGAARLQLEVTQPSCGEGVPRAVPHGRQSCELSTNQRIGDSRCQSVALSPKQDCLSTASPPRTRADRSQSGPTIAPGGQGNRNRPRFVKTLWAIAGFASFALGAVGAVLPVIPTTPLILLAAFCFARSSDRLNNWFKSTRLYKTVLEGYVTKRSMTVKAKLSIIAPVTVVMGLAFAFMGNVLVVGGVPVARVILAAVWAAHIVYFGFIVKTDKTAARSGAEGAGPADAGAGRPANKSKGMPMIKTRLLELLSEAKAHIWYQVGWKWLSLLAQVLIALCAARLVQMAFDDAWITWDAAWCVAFVFAGIVMRIWCDRREQANVHLASVDVKRELRARIYEKLLRLGASYRESVPTSKVVQLAVEGVEQVETYFSLFIPQFFYAFLAPVTLFVVVGLAVSWTVALVLLVFVPLIPLSIMAVQTIAKRLLSRYWVSYAALGDTFLENLQGLTTLKVYQADGLAAERMDEDSEAFRVATMNVLKMQLNSTTIMDIGAYGGAAAGMIVALWQFFAGGIAVGGMVVVLLLAAEFFLPMRRLGSYFHVGMNGMAASDSIFELLDLPERDEGAGASLGEGPVSFALEGAGFSYDGERAVLRDVTMEFPAGSFTAIVGASGCGKSTVAGLLMGRNRSYSGSVAANGIELADIDERSLMAHVTLVAHDSHLFKGTVRDNLMVGNPDSAESELRAAVEAVNLAGFLDSQDGLDTHIAEGGKNLSGGQRQRLVLARALLHDTPAYIFDEATSSIDVESEELIMQAVRELARTRTVVLISHRLANVVAADNIYLMEDGRVAERGTHAQLLAAGGPYAELFNRQVELESYASAAPDGGRRPSNGGKGVSR